MKIIQRHQATACDVIVSGDRVALYGHGGSAGTVLLWLPWIVFARAARGERDANGAPFPLEAPPSGRGRRGALPTARLRAYWTARRLYETEGLTRAQAATRCGLKKNTFIGWLRKERAAERRRATT